MKNLSESLPKTTKLIVTVKPSKKDEQPNSSLYNNPGLTSVELVLQEDLHLDITKHKVHDCACHIPALRKAAKSINHAATLISESYELSRTSHTKDIYREVYFQDNDGKWIALGEWRDSVCPKNTNISYITKRLTDKVNEPNDFNRILGIINISKEIAEAIVTIQEKDDDKQDIEVQKLLNTLVGVSKLKDILKTWNDNQHNSNESFWQKLLAKNSFILAQIFSTPVTILHSQVYVGGKGIENTGGSIIDFLLVNKLTQNTALIEIKTPSVRLLASEYRSGNYPISSDISGAVVQVASSKDSLLKEYDRLKNQSGQSFKVFAPLCIVIAGHSNNELSDPNKMRSFELYRASQKDVQIITYDEVFEKIRTLVELLEGKN